MQGIVNTTKASRHSRVGLEPLAVSDLLKDALQTVETYVHVPVHVLYASSNRAEDTLCSQYTLYRSPIPYKYCPSQIYATEAYPEIIRDKLWGRGQGATPGQRP